MRLDFASSSFGISLSPEGHHRYELSFDLEGLPDPKTLGDYTTYAWVTTPLMSPMRKLGEVSNGVNDRVGRVELNQFLVLVSAEASADVSAREGRLVLRGMSPSTRIQPDDHLMIPAGKSSGGTLHDSSGWPHPPMHPLIGMIPGLEDLRPRVKPFLPNRVIVEQVFNWPGTGRLAWQAALDRDYPVLLGITLVAALVIRVGHMLKEATQVAVNPQLAS